MEEGRSDKYWTYRVAAPTLHHLPVQEATTEFGSTLSDLAALFRDNAACSKLEMSLEKVAQTQLASHPTWLVSPGQRVSHTSSRKNEKIKKQKQNLNGQI